MIRRNAIRPVFIVVSAYVCFLISGIMGGPHGGRLGALFGLLTLCLLLVGIFVAAVELIRRKGERRFTTWAALFLGIMPLSGCSWKTNACELRRSFLSYTCSLPRTCDNSRVGGTHG